VGRFWFAFIKTIRTTGASSIEKMLQSNYRHQKHAYSSLLHLPVCVWQCHFAEKHKIFGDVWSSGIPLLVQVVLNSYLL
jgi:hypothetical protein